MAGYLARRLSRAILTALGAVLLVFLLVRLVPGDPVDGILGEQASPAQRAALREQLHLDDPLPLQLAAFLGDVADGTFGRSFRRPDRTVGSRIAEVAGPTVRLALASLGLALALALPLGVLAASRRGTRTDRLVGLVAAAGLAIPNVWLGPLLVLAFAIAWPLLPLPGDDAPGALLLPALTLGTALAATLMRQTRAATLEALGQPFVRAARARGLSRGAVLRRHALRSALLPVLTVAGAQLGGLLSGAVVVETIFERRGLGTLFVEAFFARDLPVVQGCALVIALSWVLVNLLLDLAYDALDPRSREAP
ncbi:MAG: ABC transporter permease [Myxococcota bacterium]